MFISNARGIERAIIVARSPSGMSVQPDIPIFCHDAVSLAG